MTASLRPTVHRFTVDEYRRMISAGILSEDSNVELLEGRIVHKMSRNPPHDVVLDQANEALRARLAGAQWRVRIQSAITLAPDSEPEPDIAVVIGPASRYAQSHPVPGQIALVVEVADTTLEDDRLEKGRIYARAGLPVYWIINVRERQVEVYMEPTGGGEARYQNRRDWRIGQAIPLVLFDQRPGQLLVDELFGI